MMNTNSPRNPNYKLMFEKHISYEIEMVCLTYWRLNTGITDQEMINLYHESFCLHVKTLLEFFIRKPKDAFASAADFAGTNYARLSRQRGSEVDGILGKLNIEVSHLSWARPDDSAQQIDQPQREIMMGLVRRETKRWVENLQSEFPASALPLKLLDSPPQTLKLFVGATLPTPSSEPKIV